jgi:hypothetical protein
MVISKWPISKTKRGTLGAFCSGTLPESHRRKEQNLHVVRLPQAEREPEIASHNFNASLPKNGSMYGAIFAEGNPQVLCPERHKTHEIQKHYWPSITQTPLRASLVSRETCDQAAMRRMGRFPKRRVKDRSAAQIRLGLPNGVFNRGVERRIGGTVSRDHGSGIGA